MGESKCKACGTTIAWVKNENGKSEPFDARPCRVMQAPGKTYKVFTDEATVIEPPLTTIVEAHLPHFVTCPQANRFRKKS